MTDHRSDDALNESAIDREIKAALSVDPSPAFLARIRTRVANEPTRAAWSLPWLVVAAGAAVATIVIAVVVSRSSQRADSASVDRAPRVAKPAVEARAIPRSVVPVEQPGAAAVDITPKAEVRAAVASGLGRTEPEILISAAETRALRRLLNGIREGRIDLRMLPPELPQTIAVVQPLDDIEPIAIEPLESAAQGEGVPQ